MLLLISSMCAAVETDSSDAREPTDVADSRNVADTQSSDALRKEVFGLATGGGAVKALEEAKARPDVFTPVDIAQLEELAVRQQVRGGRDKARAMTSPDRFDALDSALQEADRLDANWPRTPDYAAVRYALAGDRTVAFAGRGKMKDAVASYESIPSSAEISVEALGAAGDAYSYLNQPDKAEEAYRRAVRQATAAAADPATRGYQYGTRTRPIDLREGLFYALCDQGKYVEAGKVLDEISASLPPADQVRPEDVANDDYQRLYRLRAQYLIYVGKPDAGLAEFKRLEQQIPFSADVRNAEADTLLGQSRVRAARDVYTATLNDHPDNVEALSGLGRTSIDIGDYSNARQINDALDNTFPENGAVRNFQRDYRAFHAPVMSIDVNAEHGNSVLADNSFSTDVFLYSPPIADYWRALVHTFYGYASTDIGNVNRIRQGVGGDYRRGPLTVLGELTRSFGPDGRTGGNGEVEYAFSDYFKATAAVDSDDNALPWKAYVEHIWGRTARAGFSFANGDRQSANLSYSVGRYSDSNFHQEITIGGTQRVFTAANQLINVSLTGDTSSNTVANAAYFNPSRDYSIEATAMHQWSIWRRGERALQQRIFLSGGAYNERGFGTSAFWGARIEHAWTFTHDITFSYGIGVASHVYDGSRELSETGYLVLNVPF
ncbi:tetratricopeptide repeat protein [Paraburkholderia sp. GAS348]|uniref:tetratricopeptide repeat protein n=1 Tax=Paraburkholderia sp. GAS348 TaxID=3035132 RepID=UPI003D1BADBF